MNRARNRSRHFTDADRHFYLSLLDRHSAERKVRVIAHTLMTIQRAPSCAKMRTMRMSLPIMCPPSTPMSAAIFPCARAWRTSAAVRAKSMSCGNRLMFSWTASIWSKAFGSPADP